MSSRRMPMIQRASVGTTASLVSEALLILAVAFASGCAKTTTVVPNRINAGAAAPSFILQDIYTSEPVRSLSVVSHSCATVIIIWSMACPTCREALMDCEKVREAYANNAVSFIGVNFDRENVHGVRAFLKAEGIKFTNVWDGASRVVRAYKARDYTFSLFVVNRKGRVVLAQYDHPPDLASLLSKTLDATLARDVGQK